MKRIQTLVCSSLAVALLSLAGTANAADIKTRKDCEAADGAFSRMGGMKTCTVPLIEAEFRDETKHVSSCAGEIIGGGSFCQIIIDTKFNKSKPNCKALKRKQARDTRDAEAVQKDMDTPMSDAWKCEREKRIRAQRNK